MLQSGERYINPLTDFGFKRIFGSPFNKELLIDFLNALLEGEREVSDVQYRNSENLGTNEKERRAIFDVYCQSKDGSRFIVEMQNVYQEFFKDRSIYYSTFPISEQGKRGDWNYELQPVYTIGILNFTFPEDKRGENGVYKEVKLVDVKTKDIFYDKLTYIYVELANFNKTIDELKTTLDKWIYVLKHLQGLLERPPKLQGRVFEKLFRTAEISQFTSDELRDYEQSINAYRDIKNGMDTAKAEGYKKGKAEGIAEGKKRGIAEGKKRGIVEGMKKGEERGARDTALALIKRMKSKGYSIEDISEITGLTIEQIKDITV